MRLRIVYCFLGIKSAWLHLLVTLKDRKEVIKTTSLNHQHSDCQETYLISTVATCCSIGPVVSSRCTTRIIASASNALPHRLAGLLDALRDLKSRWRHLDLLNTRTGRIVVPYVVCVLIAVCPLFKAAAGVSDSAWRILASQEQVAIGIGIKRLS